jgi:hypothetical protein
MRLRMEAGNERADAGSISQFMGYALWAQVSV